MWVECAQGPGSFLPRSVPPFFSSSLCPSFLGHISKTDSLEKTRMLGSTEGRRTGLRGLDGWMASQTQWT